MADIHILAGPFAGNGSGFYRVIYHVPVPAVNYPQDQGRESEVPNLDAVELTALQSGSLFERGENYHVNRAISVNDARAAIRLRWHEVANEVSDMLSNSHRFYGTTLNRS